MSAKEQAHDKDKENAKRKHLKPAADNMNVIAQQQPTSVMVIRKSRHDSNALNANDVQQLQGTLGNQMVSRLLAQTVIQREGTPESHVQAADGVPEWAQEEYRRESKRTAICSMTPDGKIGSVYLGEEGRIRTTHGEGPIKEKFEGLTTVQFNIDMRKAKVDFQKANPKVSFDKWLFDTLKDLTVDTVPEWATPISGPESALELEKGSTPPKNLKLIEIFKSINGRAEIWHPSRGTAVKFETDKQTISVLEAAIAHIDDPKNPIAGAEERNKAFYAFVKSRLPNFVQNIRSPEEI